MLSIGMIFSTGFGQTTSDLTANSTAEVYDAQDVLTIEAPVSVVSAQEVSNEIDWVVFKAKLKIAAKEAAAETDAKLEKDLHEIYQDCYKMVQNQLLLLSAEPVNLTKEDFKVGWQNVKNLQLTPERTKDPGGELSLFYI